MKDQLDRVLDMERRHSSGRYAEMVTFGRVTVDLETETETFTPLECPWCAAHPHREPCCPRCARARELKAQLQPFPPPAPARTIE